MDTKAEDLTSLRWRPIGPFRGGRVVAVAGDPRRPMTLYFGSTGGGVWKTTNGGTTWINLTDGQLGSASVGALAVADADPNVIYAGMGECCLRGNISPGDGVYRSVDAGATWHHLGLAEQRHIGRILVDPRDAETVFVAALGHAFGPSEGRGVYRSRDGGTSWQLVLAGTEDAGAVDMAMDPGNPRHLFATLWEARRQPWTLSSGGEGSGLYRSVDGGDSWQDITTHLKLSPGPVGRIGVALSPSRPRRVWAIVEASDGGLFRSDDGGETFARVSARSDLSARSFYYMHLTAHPTDPDTIFVMNHLLWKSTDGGENFSAVASPHPDHHALWIDPCDPQRMILGCDGGAAVSFDGGDSWSSVYNQPTAEFYHVTVDRRFPYRLYGAQQDNSTLSVPSRSDALGIGMKECYDVGGSESGYIAVRPDDPDIVYAGSSGGGEGGRITRYNHRLRQRRVISPWPERTGGMAAAEYTHRFQWTSPIVLSPHDPNVLYMGGECVFVTEDEGETWRAISPDLTTNDKSKQGPSGGPINRDQSGVEVYCTIFAIAESPLKEGIIWAGSDDGLVHVTQDGGKSWHNVTPPSLPQWSLISIIEPSPHHEASAYLAATRYKLDDTRPYLFRTRDFGKTWEEITSGIPEGEYTRVVRADPRCPGLLFAGTERGVHVSFSDGDGWEPLRLNLPTVAIHDLAVAEDDLCAATHGRSFWILDDLGPLRALAADRSRRNRIFAPKPAMAFALDTLMYLPKEQDVSHPVTVQELPGANVFYLARRPGPHEAAVLLDAGENPPTGAVIHYFIEHPVDGLVLRIEDEAGRLVTAFKGAPAGESGARLLPSGAGAHRVVWDMRYDGAEPIPGESGPPVCAPIAPPGRYRLILEGLPEPLTAELEVVAHPGSESTVGEMQSQFAFELELKELASRIHRAVGGVRGFHESLRALGPRLAALGGAQMVEDELTEVGQRLAEAADALVRGSALTHQGNIGASPRLVDQVTYLFEVATSADRRPTAPTLDLYRQVKAAVEAALARIEAERPAVERLNGALSKLALPYLSLDA